MKYLIASVEVLKVEVDRQAEILKASIYASQADEICLDTIVGKKVLV